MSGRVMITGVVMAVMAVLLLTVSGCGGSGPSAAAEDFLKAAQDKKL